MGRVFLPRYTATDYAPKAGETLAEIVAAKCQKVDPPITCEEVALFNWGTMEPPEVLRAVVELVGCRKVVEDPFLCELDPSKGLQGKIRLPKVWSKTDLAYEKEHKLIVKKQLPATAIAITSLDAWFLPGEETCNISYRLEGIKERAKFLDFDVYASNYCKATATVHDDLVDYSYADTPDVPIRQKSISTDAAERFSGDIADWKGESEAASGVLAPRAGKKRYINAASSPYSVVLRYAKTDSHKNAFVNLHSFWPKFSGTGADRAVVDDSLKIKWTAKNLPGGLQGQIQVFDKDGMVWRAWLPTAKTGNGEQEFDWSSDGKAMVTEAQMPYRAQVQLHTDKDTDDGFAIAAMHTEVRLFTHPEIGTHGDDHEQEPQVLEFALAPYYAGPAPPEDSAKGRKLRLAKAGYHPGPVKDGEGQAAYIQAVREFQRDHVKPGSNPPERLKNDGTLDGDTKTAIAALAPGRRPLFGDSSDRSNIDAGDVADGLNDKDTEMIVWVDDRHSYTKIEAASRPYLLPNMDLGNYHGDMDGTDIKEAKDQAATCRPWIPLEVALPILRKGDPLGGSVAPEVNDASRAATGPIRVDWTFRDTAVDYKVDTTQYQASRGRPLKYLTDVFTAIKGTHNGKDAWNCTTALGGIRGADYYKAPFAIEADSLMPCKALADSGVKAVCSVAHDDLGQDEKQLFDKQLGKAGVYFHPSIIGGDGYQLRSQMSFRDLPTGSTHPNWKVLRERYDVTKLPQAHTAPFRLWRKDTFRAHVPWAPAAEITWGTKDVQMVPFYEPGMVHFEYEGGASVSIPLDQLLTNANDYVDLVDKTVTGPKGTNPKVHRYRPKSEMEFNKEYLWPWWKIKHFGIQEVPAPATRIADYESVFLENHIYNDSWYTYAPPLVHLLLARVERSRGLLRGHLISEFRSSPQYWKEFYKCNRCNTLQILIELTAAGGSATGEPCRVGACPGTLEETASENFTCDVCGFHFVRMTFQGWEGRACTQRCAGTLQVQSMSPVAGQPNRSRVVYACGVCARTRTFTEATATAGAAHLGQACGRNCTGHFRGDAATHVANTIVGPMDHLNFPAIGEPLASLWLMTDGGPRTFWTHEVGHHKHLEHAGDVIVKATQHDHTRNTVDAGLNPPNSVPTDAARWDRTCIMSYANTESGADAAYFCGKCILKLRGWKIEGSGAAAGPNSGDKISDPAAGVTGP
ncbi:MAG: peptidoglycan-binding protein [Acidobacteria bacterium]|nr:peptidoglycan-binding protein [Acidobacteriota bacterium]